MGRKKPLYLYVDKQIYRIKNKDTSQVSSVPQGLHHVSLLSHGLLDTTKCDAVTVCGDVADDYGLRIAEEFSADFLHSLVLSAYWILAE